MKYVHINPGGEAYEKKTGSMEKDGNSNGGVDDAHRRGSFVQEEAGEARPQKQRRPGQRSLRKALGERKLTVLPPVRS